MDITADQILQNIGKRLFPNMRPTQLARVVKVHEGPGEGKYSLDVVIVNPGNLEETDVPISEVQLNPVWAGPNGRGIYCPPAVGQVVIIGYIQGNPAYPYVAGIWSNGYQAGGFKEGEFLITDGDAEIKISADSLVTITSKQKSLKAVLEKLSDKIKGIMTMGPPPQHTVAPTSQLDLETLKGELNQLFKE